MKIFISFGIFERIKNVELDLLMDSSDKQVKIIFILIDGIGDVGYPQHGGKTPLQAAKLPTINALARSGKAWF